MYQEIQELMERIVKLAPEIDTNELLKIMDDYNVEPKENPYSKASNYELLTMYLDAKDIENLSKGTLKNYKLALTKLFEAVDKPVTRMTVVDLRIYLLSHKNWKTSTLATNIYSIRSFFTWMKNENIIIKSEADKLKAPKEEQRKKKDLSPVEVEQIKLSCKSLRDRAFIETLLSTGGRISEISQLNISDINFDSKKIKVFGKGSKERYVFLNDTAAYYLKKYFAQRTDECEALFVTSKGVTKRLTNRALQKVTEDITIKTGIHVHCHKFRHTFACNMLKKGVELGIIKEFMGHSSVDTTMGYAKVDDDRLQYEHNRCA